MKVLKFGGSSLSTPENIKKVKDIILSEINTTDEFIIVVLSAVSGITDLLLKISKKLKNQEIVDQELQTLKEKFESIIQNLLKEEFKITCKISLEQTIDTVTKIRNESNNITKREEKIILAQGEIFTSFIFHNFLKQERIDNTLVNALDFMKINEDREPDYDYIKSLASKIFTHSNKLYITQGYICRNYLGEIDNLGKGGSDYTASIIGYTLNASEIQIWSDASGIYNNDPRFVRETHPISYLTFDEAAELAYFGAKVLHPSTVLPAQKGSIPIILKNTFNPFAAGTVITNLIISEGFKAVASKDNITIIQIKSYRMLRAYGFLRRIFEIFERYKVPVDVITTSEVSVSLTIDDETHLNDITSELSTFANVEVIKNNTVVTCVGYIPKNKPGYLHRVLSLLEKIPIRMLSYGSSDYSITLVIDTVYKQEVLNRLNQLFI